MPSKKVAISTPNRGMLIPDMTVERPTYLGGDVQ